jgi:formate C-acetyltransferase
MSILKSKKDVNGFHIGIGNLQGYNHHNKFFGSNTKATPDGRYDGENLKFGIGQSGGNDREGLTALLNAVAKCDKTGVCAGSSVTNIFLDEQLVVNDDNFEKTLKLLETYLKNGGIQFQLNYISKEELKKAKVNPEEYKSLRVRVSGYSDYFVNLSEPIQDDIIERTVHK